MQRNRNLNGVFNVNEDGNLHMLLHMLLLRLSSSSSSFAPPLGLSSAPSWLHPVPLPAPPPWCLAQRSPPWPPRQPPSRFPVGQLRPLGFNYGSSGRRLFSASAGLRMERPPHERGPPYKRRKSSEERRGTREEEPRRGAGGRSNEPDLRPHQSRPPKDKAPPAGTRKQEGARDRPANANANTTIEHCNKDQKMGGANKTTSPPRASAPVKPLQRHWESCSSTLQPPGGSASFYFSVMSYNILSQQLLHDNSYLYGHCGAAVLPWNYRLPNLLDEIRRHDADILCLQEVQQDHYEEQIKPTLQELGYQCEYKKRTGKKPDGCAIVFKSSLFSLVSSNPVEFFRQGDALLDRDNVGQVVLLRPLLAPPSCFVCVANTHLLYNPRRGDIKLAQLVILLAEITRLSRLPDGSTNPVVLCGDFNSTPWSPLYSFLTTGRLDCRQLPIGTVSGQEISPRGQRLLSAPLWSPTLGISRHCQYEKENTSSAAPPGGHTAVDGDVSNLSVEEETNDNRMTVQHSLTLRSSYRHRLDPDGRPEITTCHSRTAMTVDYIMYTPDVAGSPSLPGGRGLQLLSRLSLVGQPELEEVNGLPNRNHSSDHLPLLARFCLRL